MGKNAAIVLLGDMLLMTVIKTVPHIKKQKDTCTPVLTEALFTIATTWKQPKHPLRENWLIKYGTSHIPTILEISSKWNPTLCGLL